MKKITLITTIALVLALTMLLSPLGLDIGRDDFGDLYGKIYIGNALSALDFDSDFECDGVNDEVQFRAAIAALPPEAGMLYVSAGAYQFADGETVSSNLTGVSIVGLGACTTFTGDGTTPLFQATADGWLFMNLRVDAGGLDMADTEDWCWINVGVGSTLYSVYTDAGQPGGMEQHNNDWHSINFATVTSLDALEDVVDGLELDLIAFDTTLTQVLADIASLNSTVIDIGTSVDALSTDLGTLQTDVQALEAASHSQGTDTALGTLGTLSTPNASDKVIYRDTSDSNALVTSTMAEVRTYFKGWYDTLYADQTHADTHQVGATDTIFPADPDADKVLQWDDSAGEFVWIDAGSGSGDMLKSVYDTDDDGDIDTSAGGTEWDSSSATGTVHIVSGTWATRLDLVDQTIAEVSLYIDTGSGNDANPGTSGSPKATILGALDALPTTIAHTCYLHVRPGTYPEANEFLEFSRFNSLTNIIIKAVNHNDQHMYDNGEAESGTSDTLTDTDKAWATNQFDGAYIWLYSGTGEGGAIKEVESNTATVITIVGTWETNPANASFYAIGGGVTMSGTGAYHVRVNAKKVDIYGFRHTGATSASMAWVNYALGNAFYHYIVDVASSGSGVFVQALSDVRFMYNYVDVSGSGTQYGCRIVQGSCWPRANLIRGDDSTCYGIRVERVGLGQMTSAAALQNTLRDCVTGVWVAEGSGCQQITVQNYLSCATSYSVDSTSWNT